MSVCFIDSTDGSIRSVLVCCALRWFALRCVVWLYTYRFTCRFIALRQEARSLGSHYDNDSLYIVCACQTNTLFYIVFIFPVDCRWAKFKKHTQLLAPLSVCLLYIVFLIGSSDWLLCIHCQLLGSGSGSEKACFDTSWWQRSADILACCFESRPQNLAWFVSMFGAIGLWYKLFLLSDIYSLQCCLFLASNNYAVL